MGCVRYSCLTREEDFCSLATGMAESKSPILTANLWECSHVIGESHSHCKLTRKLLAAGREGGREGGRDDVKNGGIKKKGWMEGMREGGIREMGKEGQMEGGRGRGRDLREGKGRTEEGI